MSTNYPDLLYNANQCVNLAVTAANHFRKYLPAELTEADRMALEMLERAVKSSNGHFEKSPGYLQF